MKYRIKSKLWIEGDGEIIMGEGRFQLLKAIDEAGSLSAAAKNMDISYKKAWKLMDTVNKNSNKPVLKTLRGGQGGGGVELTPYGKELISRFDKIRKDCWEYLKKSEAILLDL